MNSRFKPCSMINKRGEMEIQVQKWDNSLAIRIPRSFALQTRIENGSIVDLTLFQGTLVATPLQKEKNSHTEQTSSASNENIPGKMKRDF